MIIYFFLALMKCNVARPLTVSLNDQNVNVQNPMQKIFSGNAFDIFNSSNWFNSKQYFPHEKVINSDPLLKKSNKSKKSKNALVHKSDQLLIPKITKKAIQPKIKKKNPHDKETISDFLSLYKNLIFKINHKCSRPKMIKQSQYKHSQIYKPHNYDLEKPRFCEYSKQWIPTKTVLKPKIKKTTKYVARLCYNKGWIPNYEIIPCKDGGWIQDFTISDKHRDDCELCCKEESASIDQWEDCFMPYFRQRRKNYSRMYYAYKENTEYKNKQLTARQWSSKYNKYHDGKQICIEKYGD